MSYQNISSSITAADKQAVQAAIQTIRTKLPFLIVLAMTERKRLRKMGPAGVPYVQDVYNAAVSNPGAITTGFSLTEYGKDLQLFKDLTEIISWLTPIYEGIDDTHLALGNELMKQSDECYGYLKVASKKSSNQSLKDTVAVIASLLKKGPRKPPPSNPNP